MKEVAKFKDPYDGYREDYRIDCGCTLKECKELIKIYTVELNGTILKTYRYFGAAIKYMFDKCFQKGVAIYERVTIDGVNYKTPIWEF